MTPSTQTSFFLPSLAHPLRLWTHQLPTNPCGGNPQTFLLPIPYLSKIQLCSAWAPADPAGTLPSSSCAQEMLFLSPGPSKYSLPVYPVPCPHTCILPSPRGNLTWEGAQSRSNSPAELQTIHILSCCLSVLLLIVQQHLLHAPDWKRVAASEKTKSWRNLPPPHGTSTPVAQWHLFPWHRKQR